MQQKLPLNRIPNEYQFEYVKSFRRLFQIRDSLKGFYPESETQEQWLAEVLQEYQELFVKIAEINKHCRKKR